MTDYSKITKHDIEEAMAGNLEVDGVDYDWLSDETREAVRYPWGEGKFVEGLGTFKPVVDWMTREYEDSYCHNVVLHVESGKYYKSVGYYSSWDGTNWSEGSFEEVEPYEKTVTRYRTVS
jgi:hypothetical protein